MKLYLIHCGFYDESLCQGLYETHVNFFVVAKSFEEARLRAKQIPEFQRRRMHVDGLQEIAVVDGFKISLSQDLSLNHETQLFTNRHRDLAPASSKEIG